ncbi:MAG: VOC family protein [Pseudomonadota bacterium]
MLIAVSVGTDDLDSSKAFYDALLATLGMVRSAQNATEAGYSTPGTPPIFYINLPYNKAPATSGNGTQVSFAAPDRAAVDRFHAKALDLGGTDEGAPGERDYKPGYYGAYCRDTYGNKLHVAHVPD